MKLIFPFAFATIYGLSMRLLVGLFDDLLGVMTIAFLCVLPIVLGFLTVFFIPKNRNPKLAASIFLPWITSLFILLITIAFSIEGTICWLMIYPLFAILSSVGGIIGHYARKSWINRHGEQRDNKWGPPHTFNMSLILFLPLLIGMLEGERTTSRKDFIVMEEIIINAPKSVAWHTLLNIDKIREEERTRGFAELIGFPAHLSTTLDKAEKGGIRVANYERGLYFTETISEYKNEEKMVLDIDVDPLKIPPTVMDEHIVIGGKHVDIIQDSYNIVQLADGNTKLSLSSKFYINTPFNWYAGIWSEWLMKDILKSELALIKQRSEK